MRFVYFTLVVALSLLACNSSNTQTTQKSEQSTPPATTEPAPDYSKSKTPSLAEASLVEALADYEQAIFASGCFWKLSKNNFLWAFKVCQIVSAKLN